MAYTLQCYGPFSHKLEKRPSCSPYQIIAATMGFHGSCRMVFCALTSSCGNGYSFLRCWILAISVTTLNGVTTESYICSVLGYTLLLDSWNDSFNPIENFLIWHLIPKGRCPSLVLLFVQQMLDHLDRLVSSGTWAADHWLGGGESLQYCTTVHHKLGYDVSWYHKVVSHC